MDTIIAVGLGNPGAEYDQTRHNVGFMVVDELCRRFRKRLKPGKGDFFWTAISIGPSRMVLVKPLTYMNNSGLAVVDVLRQCEATPAEVLVVSDDFSLPLGHLRIRTRGSDGGHNGLLSVIYHLQTDGFPRLRCGIGTETMPPKEGLTDFVLSPFVSGELDTVTQMIRRAADAVTAVATTGLERTMSVFNT